MFENYLKLKDGKYYVAKDFDFHIPKKCADNIQTEPNIMMLGKIYTSDGNAFDVTQCTSSLSEPSSYTEEKDRMILKYKEGDFFCNEQMVRTIANVELLFKLLIGGQILDDLDYQSNIDAFLDSMDNNVSLSAPRNFFEYIISIFVRNKDNIEKYYRFNKEDDGKSASISLPNALMLSDTFVAMTSRDPLTMLITSIGKDGKQSSALEDMFKK